ncbi:hypothetical protein [Streptomyces profundus]|uniref:hypothetical protein n=1 Tax=Streptomyces profundus TaxID=2867410 RepID=UPI001D1659A6|nr:hypothetical protein [Streptomyces sp. MA3_2.13]UED85191.1 hypothetical protein K4G22_14115 [Streptomyces sp. MA3_2.13]
MAHNPQAPQGPQGPRSPQDIDPAGSTQMFQAFVNDGPAPSAGPAATPPPASSGPRVGLIVGVVVGVLALAAVVYLLAS